MPTAAKLIAGLAFALVGCFTALVFNNAGGPDSGLSSGIVQSCAIIGFMCGWLILGNRPGLGGFESVWFGVMGVITSLIVACFLFGFMNLIDGLMGGTYANPTAALMTWLRVSVYLFIDTIQMPVWSTLVLGGAISGRLAGIANLRWT